MPERTALASPEQPLSLIMARLAEVQKSNRGAPGYARWVNRRLGRLLAAMAFKRSLTPNQVTVLSAVFTFTAIAIIAAVRPGMGASILITVLLAFGFALDAADGQLARLRGGGSAAGEWLDHVIDATKCSALHLAVLVCWYRFYELSHPALLLIPLIFALQSAVFFFAIILTEQLRRSARRILPSAPPSTQEAAPVLRSIIVLPADYGLMCLTFVLLSSSTAFIVVYASLAAANVAFLLGALPRWYRDMKALG